MLRRLNFPIISPIITLQHLVIRTSNIYFNFINESYLRHPKYVIHVVFQTIVHQYHTILEGRCFCGRKERKRNKNLLRTFNKVRASKADYCCIFFMQTLKKHFTNELVIPVNKLNNLKVLFWEIQFDYKKNNQKCNHCGILILKT